MNTQGFNATLPGQENNTYDNQTTLALKAFQEKYASDILTPVGLTEGTGNFGTSTRQKVNIILGCPEEKTPVVHIQATDEDLVILPDQSGTVTINTTNGQITLEIAAHNVTSETTFSVTK